MAAKNKKQEASNGESSFDRDAPLSKAWIREIRRRVKDSDDPRRYIIVSILLPGPPRRWELFYDVSDDMWAMDLAGATLFKRKQTALTVASPLGDRYQVIEVRLGKNGKVVRPRKRRGSSRQS